MRFFEPNSGRAAPAPAPRRHKNSIWVRLSQSIIPGDFTQPFSVLHHQSSRVYFWDYYLIVTCNDPDFISQIIAHTSFGFGSACGAAAGCSVSSSSGQNVRHMEMTACEKRSLDPVFRSLQRLGCGKLLSVIFSRYIVTAHLYNIFKKYLRKIAHLHLQFALNTIFRAS